MAAVDLRVIQDRVDREALDLGKVLFEAP